MLSQLKVEATNHEIEQRVYAFTSEPIDVLIPCVEKDLLTLEKVIEGIKKHGKNIRDIYVVSRKKLTMEAKWVPEMIYPFTKEDVAYALCDKSPSSLRPAQKESYAFKSRVGWYYQQLLKFYAPYVIQDISPNVLILDADTIFLRSVEFMDERGAPFFAFGEEFHFVYFQHAKRLLPGLRKVFPEKSGICHHMLFQRPVIDALFEHVEKEHQTPFWKAFCETVDATFVEASGASEYEIYFNFLFLSSLQPTIRPLLWKNIYDLDDVPKYAKKKYHYVSCHEWMRKKK